MIKRYLPFAVVILALVTFGAMASFTDTPDQPVKSGEKDWVPEDGHKMHFPQLPNETGWDVNATQPMILADDWQCSETGWVKDVHFWGSWKDGLEGQIVSFVLSIHSDIPADPPGIPYSRPGQTLWEREVTEFVVVPIDPPSMEGWYDPMSGETLFENNGAYNQYNVFLPEEDWFWQDSGTIYWLNISAIVADPAATTWGWKSTEDHWNDDAVWGLWGALNWIDIWEPEPPNVNEFFAQIDPAGFLIGGGGTDFYGDGWYEYPSGWYNIWFYDHEFDFERKKQIHIEFDVFKLDPGLPSFVVVAANWSTPEWSIEGNPPPDPRIPPLPGVDENLYIVRDTIIIGPDLQGHFIYDYEIPDYNPEWVSIDIDGENFEVMNGIIDHRCIGSLDLSFVITGGEEEPVGACCYPDPTGGTNVLCVVTTATDCANTYGGAYQGDGTVCGGALEACCLPDGSCIDADPFCCVNQLGGVPQGPGTQCTTPIACCLPDGTCINADPLCCGQLGGVPSPWGAPACLGDGNGNSIDDACEEEEPEDTCDYYKAPYPDYVPNGMPDFDQKQNGWVVPIGGPWSHCGPVALANCLWWFDSKFEPQPLDPRPFFPSAASPLPNDNYPLVQSYGPWDDHDTNNVIPFVDSLAKYSLTNGPGLGTNIHNMNVGFTNWLDSVGLTGQYVVTMIPGDGLQYEIIRDEVLASQDVILLFGFFEDGADGLCHRLGGHYVTTAGICTQEQAICISDPYYDMQEGEPPAGSAHASGVHNDAFYVSGPHGTIHHDKYQVGLPTMACQFPLQLEVYGYPMNPTDLNNFAFMNDVDFPSEPYNGGPIHTLIEWAMIICPSDTCANQMPGDADGSGIIDNADTLFLINLIENGGPAPSPMANGDANGDCIINYQDIAYIAAYVNAGGPPPVACTCVNPTITCCIGITGNVNCDVGQNVDISDLTALVNHLFVTFQPLCCPEEANTNGDLLGQVDISDLTKLVNHLFVTFEALAHCL